MRIHLTLSPSTENVPFNYQGHLVEALHRWMGENPYHDDLSLYSFSWLTGDYEQVKNGLRFPKGATCFISAYDDEAVSKRLVGGLVNRGRFAFGMEVTEVRLMLTPKFSARQYFHVETPVFIKRKTADGNTRYYYPSDAESSDLLTETLQRKLLKAGLEESVRVRFDTNYAHIKSKTVTYKRIQRKATYCPVIVEGSPLVTAFAWNVGVGSNTGLGFGTLK